jgi:hypothetical protein
MFKHQAGPDTTMTTTKPYRIHLNQVPQHERIIFKLICSVSGKTPGRTRSYALAEEGNGQTDILIHGDMQAMREASSFAAAGILHACLVDKSQQDIADNHIPRPLLATRVLTILDGIVTRNEQTPEAAAPAGPAPTGPAVEPVSPAVPDFEFDISIEDASELAVVEDETFVNPANFQLKQDLVTTRRPAPDPVPSLAIVESDQAETSGPPDAGSPTKLPRALVVDDSPSVRKQLELEL